MRESLVQLAKALELDAAAKLRIAVVTALVGDKVTTDATGTALVTTNSDSFLSVGDRVALLQQKSAWVVIARLSGSYPTPAVQTPIGAIIMWPQSGTNPAGWLRCNGNAVSRTTYATLFAIIGTTYGAGDGSTTFNLPNMVARFPLGADGGSYPVGGTGGEATHTITASEMPAHTHDTTVRQTNATVASGTGATVTGTATSAATSSQRGASAPMPIMPPWLGMNFCIRAS